MGKGRERERERESVQMYIYMYVCMKAYSSIIMCTCVYQNNFPSLSSVQITHKKKKTTINGEYVVTKTRVTFKTTLSHVTDIQQLHVHVHKCM